MNTIEIIKKCAEIPSFTSYEDRIHDFIQEICSKNKSIIIEKVHENNLLVFVPGKRNAPTVALSAHLDKINHWGKTFPDRLPCEIKEGKVRGQMDDSVGIGLCLQMALQSSSQSFPPLLLFFSEVEESFGIKRTPHLLKNNGDGFYSGLGAERICSHLLNKKELPCCVITIDTTPEFKGEPGVCFYDRFWHRSNFVPSEFLIQKTEKMKTFFLQKYRNIIISNANNDYIEYGLLLNKSEENAIPSVAIEPAIFPYHTKYEGVYCGDIITIEHLLIDFLNEFSFEEI